MKRHRLLYSTIITVFLGFVILINIIKVSALSYQNDVDISFTFLPVLSINLSGNLVIENLVSGSSSDSNIITISTSSNNIVGYDIKATVGNSTHDYTDLRLNSSDSTNVFSSLDSNKATLSNFADDTWGYSYSTDDGTTWVSGNTGSTSTGYNGLPLYNNTGILLVDISTMADSSIKFKIGAKASGDKISGDYTNLINFIATAKVVTTNYTINYLPNADNSVVNVTNMPNPATISGAISENTNITLSDAVPGRVNYDYLFLGWCDGTIATTNNIDTCDGDIYQPGDTYQIKNVGSATMIDLKAMWKAKV